MINRVKTKATPKKVLTTDEMIKRRQAARERHWRKTGVSAATVEWMRKRDML